MRNNPFNSPFEGYEIRQHIQNKNIQAGRHSYYSGYYHGHHFEDCARYLSPDRTDVDQLKIGAFCSIGSGVSFIMAGNQGHRMDWASTFPFHYMPEFSEAPDGFARKGDTVIGNDVWIGTEAMIMPGVHIGNGAVIGARAVVTKDVDDYSIAGGFPAKHIRYRFSEEERTMLLKLKWWDWPDEKITAKLDMLSSGDIKTLYNSES